MMADTRLLRLLQLVSPSLPIGGFTYSQGIEWAVAAGWITNAADLQAWVVDQLRHALAQVDLPILLRLYGAVGAADKGRLDYWVDRLIAARETMELRQEERQRGRALADLLVAWALPEVLAWRKHLARSQAAGMAFAGVTGQIPCDSLMLGYAWTWAEGLIVAGMKCVPLGQTQGQQILAQLTQVIPETLAIALAIEEDAIGASCPALAIASSQHESQYTRLFRS